MNKESITKGLSLEGALALLGQPRPSETNSDYPLVYSWSLNDGELLYVVFETDDRAAFLDDLQNGVYILPGETAEYGEQGVRFLTENEQNVVRQWTLNHKAVSAYCTLNGQTTVLFGASQE
ncbi:MAG: hypothetical protein J6X72_06330 [Clostridia bacterium]|nr:hypothetical protein [Clostridia bacterium]